ncbi:hypothetical protein WDU94_013185 [Cyamophila willieti]
MKYHSSKRDLFLIPLHVIGLINLPEFKPNVWWLHTYTAKSVFFCTAAMIGCLHFGNTVFYAVHDLTEFLQKLLESAIASVYVGEIFICKFQIDLIINMFDLQDEIFSVSNWKIYKKFVRKENFEISVLLLIGIIIVLGITLETILPLSDRTLYVMTSIYQHKIPSRVLPFNLYTGSIDVTDRLDTYCIVYVLEMYALVLFMVVVFEVVLLQITFPTPLVGQYEMLGEFGTMIGMEHRNSFGHFVFYTDLTTGKCITETKLLHNEINADLYEISKQDTILKVTEWRKKKYQHFYIKQIVVRHQQLNKFTSQYIKRMSHLHRIGVVPLLSALILSFYQMAYLRNLPWFHCLKTFGEFVFLMLNIWHITYQSEQLNHCNEIIERAVYQSDWYKCSPDLRRKVCMLLRTGQPKKHLSFLYGLIRFTFIFFVKILKAAFNFLNFMKIEGRL